MDVKIEVEVFRAHLEFNEVPAITPCNSLEIIVASSTGLVPSEISILLSSSGLGLHSPPGTGDREGNHQPGLVRI